MPAAPIVGDYAVAIPVASYLVGLWFVRDRFSFGGPARHVLPISAVLVALMPLQPAAVEGIAAVLAACVPVRSGLARREAHRTDAPPMHA